MLSFAIRNLLSRPARSLLSLLGLTVAMMGMVGLFSVAEGIDETVEQTFNRIPGLVCMQRGAPIPLFSRIPIAWRDEISVLPGVNVVSAELWLRVNIINKKTIVSPPRFLFGADLDAHAKLKYSVYGSAIKEGRYLSLDDRRQPRCIVSKQIAEEFKLKLGSKFKVNEIELEVVGIYHCGSLLLDVAIVVDQGYLRSLSLFDPRAVCSFYVEPTGEIPNEKLAEQIKDLFRGRPLGAWQPTSLLSGLFSSGSMSSPVITTTRSDGASGSSNPIVHALRTTDRAIKSLGPNAESSQPMGTTDLESVSPVDGLEVRRTKLDQAVPSDGDEDNEALDPLEVRTSSDWAERFGEFTSSLDVFLGVMTSLGLTIAVLSIINTMLMSVTERIIEFGILKANGWSRREVMLLITYESATLGFVGGVLGSLLGLVLTWIINWRWPDHVHLLASPSLLIFSLFFATVLGVLGGLYPALWATRMMPMEAIRRG